VAALIVFVLVEDEEEMDHDPSVLREGAHDAAWEDYGERAWAEVWEQEQPPQTLPVRQSDLRPCA